MKRIKYQVYVCVCVRARVCVREISEIDACRPGVIVLPALSAVAMAVASRTTCPTAPCRSKQATCSDGVAQYDVGREMSAGQICASQRARPLVLCKPSLYFRSLVRLTVCSHDWVPHHLHRQRALEEV
jgi:hypothetical protein